MKIKKTALALIACLVSAALFAGCGCGNESADNQPAAMTPAEMNLGEPASSFQVGEKTARIYAIKGLAADKNFIFVGERIVYSKGAIYLHGESYDGLSREAHGLYKLPLSGDAVTGKEFIAESNGYDGDKRNIAVSGDKVLFKLEESGKVGIYDGKHLEEGDGKWKDDYDSMVGFAKGDDLLLQHSNDTVCTARLDDTKIKSIKEVIDDVGDELKLEEAVLRPVYADENALFLSTPIDFDSFTTDLLSFNRKGKLLARYSGLTNDPADWAVTEHYILQASPNNDVLIYDRATGQKIHDAKVKDFAPRYLFSMGGDMVLACADETKFYILNLE